MFTGGTMSEKTPMRLVYGGIITISIVVITAFIAVSIVTPETVVTDDGNNNGVIGNDSSDEQTSFLYSGEQLTETEQAYPVNVSIREINTTQRNVYVTVSHKVPEAVTTFNNDTVTVTGADITVTDDSPVVVTNQTINQHTRSIDFTFRVNLTGDTTGFGHQFTENKVTITLPTYDIGVRTESGQFTITREQILTGVSDVAVKDSVTNHTQFTGGVFVDETIYATTTPLSKTETKTQYENMSVSIIAPANESEAITHTRNVVTAGQQMIVNTSLNTPSRHVNFIIGDVPDSEHVAGYTLGRFTDTPIAVVKHEYADTMDSTISHEWVHTIQPYGMTHQTSWWIEGSASYMGTLLDIHTGNPASTPSEEFTETEFAEINLSDPDTWPSDTRVQYQRGAKVAYIIDLGIRDATNGSQTIWDFNNWLIQQDSEITQSMFLDGVEQYADEETAQLVQNITTDGHTIPVNKIVNNNELYLDKIGSEFTSTISFPPHPLPESESYQETVSEEK